MVILFLLVAILDTLDTNFYNMSNIFSLAIFTHVNAKQALISKDKRINLGSLGSEYLLQEQAHVYLEIL